MSHINFHKKIAMCEICNEAIFEGQGNVMMMGFNGNHCVHVLHIQDDFQSYRLWRNTLLKKSV